MLYFQWNIIRQIYGQHRNTVRIVNQAVMPAVQHCGNLTKDGQLLCFRSNPIHSQPPPFTVRLSISAHARQLDFDLVQCLAQCTTNLFLSLHLIVTLLASSHPTDPSVLLINNITRSVPTTPSACLIFLFPRLFSLACRLGLDMRALALLSTSP